MKSTIVDPETGDVRCPVCGARNSFTVKRTTKAKWTAGLTIGVGALAMPKRLMCNGCGTNLKRSGGTAPPNRTKPKPTTTGHEPPAATLALVDPSWDGLAERAKAYGLTEKESFDQRWLVRGDGVTVARRNADGSISIKSKSPDFQELALSLVGAKPDPVQWYVVVPALHAAQWDALVGLAAETD